MATMKFSNLGIIRIKMPAARATIGEICARVRVITIFSVVGLSTYDITTEVGFALNGAVMLLT
jgi:hypothetical protein